MVFFPNQYAAFSTNDTLRSQTISPQISSVDSNSPVNGLQFLRPNQMTCSATLLKFVRENNATLNFPQKLMFLLSYVENEQERGNQITCISWVRNGHAFVIKDRKELVDSMLPLFFREGKFSSFTRKLYRWGFRQICIPKGGNKNNRELMFGHEDFQRDNKSLVTEMRSVTAAGTRRAIAALTSKKKARKNKDGAANKKSAHAFVMPPAPSKKRSGENTNTTKVSPTNDPKSQSLVQVHLERLLGSSYNGTSPIGQKSTQNSFDSSLLQSHPNSEHKPQNLVQAHLERLLGGSNSVTKPANITAQAPFQTPGLGQNSTQNGFDALLKAKSHSLVRPPVQNKFLGLGDTTVLQNQVNYLKAISHSSIGARSPAPSSLMQPSMSFDIGARLQAMRQMGASQQAGGQIASQARTLPTHNNMGLPKNYLDLIRGNGGLVGQTSSVPNRVSGPPAVIESSDMACPPSVTAALRQSQWR